LQGLQGALAASMRGKIRVKQQITKQEGRKRITKTPPEEKRQPQVKQQRQEVRTHEIHSMGVNYSN